MALVACRECGGQISDQAQACPHCGAPRVTPVQPPPQSKPTGLEIPASDRADGYEWTAGRKTALAAVVILVLLIIVAPDHGGAPGPTDLTAAHAKALADIGALPDVVDAAWRSDRRLTLAVIGSRRTGWHPVIMSACNLVVAARVPTPVEVRVIDAPAAMVDRSVELADGTCR